MAYVPSCPVCTRMMVRIRDDGTLSNHRDSGGEPCDGSRQKPVWREAPKIKPVRAVWNLNVYGPGPSGRERR